MKSILKVLLMITIFGCGNGHAQDNFSYKSVPNELQSKCSVSDGDRAKIVSSTSSLYDLTNCLPTGYVKDGSVDYTDLLQKGINGNQNVIFPNFAILINSQGLSLKSNSTVLFNKQSKLILKPTATDNYQVIRIYNVNNCKLYYPNIVGDRKKHLGKSGEAGMGISIRGANNVEIFNANVSDCWGDGIYLDDLSRNITLYSPFVDNNRRNGISIVYAVGVKIYNMLASNTNGTAPMSGIDIEPDNNSHIVDNILLQDPTTFNNSNRGVLIVLTNLAGKVSKTVDIDVNGHNDIGSNYGMGFYLGNHKPNVIPLVGNIRISNPNWSGSRKAPVFMSPDMSNNSVKLDIINPKVEGRPSSDIKKIAAKARNVYFN